MVRFEPVAVEPLKQTTSPVQFKTVNIFSEKPIIRCFSQLQVSPTLTLEQFQWRWPWCHRSWAFRSVSNSSTLQIFRDAIKPLDLLVCLPVYLLGYFPLLWRVQESIYASTGVYEGRVERWLMPSGFPIPLFGFRSKLIESLRRVA